MSRPKSRKEAAQDKLQEVLQRYAEAEWDHEMHRVFFGKARCFKCGSESFKEILDWDGDLVLCCSDCPDIDELN